MTVFFYWVADTVLKSLALSEISLPIHQLNSIGNSRFIKM